jgi:hypothetical protein
MAARPKQVFTYAQVRQAIAGRIDYLKKERPELGDLWLKHLLDFETCLLSAGPPARGPRENRLMSHLLRVHRRDESERGILNSLLPANETGDGSH